MNRNLLAIFYLCLFTHVLLPLKAKAEVITLPHPQVIEPRFDRDVSYYWDSDRQFDLNPSGVLAESWTVGQEKERIGVGFSTGILWARFQVHSKAAQAEAFILHFHHFAPSHIRLFEKTDKGLLELGRIGGGYPPQQLSFRAPLLNLYLSAVSPGLHDYVLAVESHGGRLGVAFDIAGAQVWAESIVYPQYLALGAFYGTLLAFLLFHAFVFINTRDRAYGIYLGYISSMILLFLHNDGFLNLYLPITVDGGWSDFGTVFGAVMVIFMTLINQVYYDCQRRFPQINRLFNLCLGSSVLLLLMFPFAPIWLTERFMDLIAFYGIVVLFGSSAYIWRQGFHPAKYLFASRLIFTAFAAVFMLHIYDFFPDSFWVDYSLQIGCLCELLLISYGLGVRMKVLEIEKAEAREGERQASFKLNWFNTLVRVITHDLSTPISVITASADLELRRSQPSVSLQKNLERIARASQQQTNLITHVRDMLAVASGKKQFVLQPVCLNSALEEAIATLAEGVEKKRLRVDLSCPDELIYVAADATALVNTVFDNFLSNAIKFSHDGAVIRLTLKTQDNDALILIEDQGIGIPPEMIDHLFDPAHATSRPGTAKELGTGFGLPLAKVYIEQFQGRILVDSRVSEEAAAASGTTFTIVLPIQKRVASPSKDKLLSA